MSFGPPTAVIINDTYPAVAHFEVDAGSFLVVEPDETCLIFLDTGIPGPPGSSGVSLKGSFSYGDATPQLIGILLAGLYNPDTRIDIKSIFDGVGAQVSIGSMADPNLLFSSSQCNPLEVSSYQVTSAFEVLADTSIYLFIQPGAGATQGTGHYWLNLV